MTAGRATANRNWSLSLVGQATITDGIQSKPSVPLLRSTRPHADAFRKRIDPACIDEALATGFICDQLSAMFGGDRDGNAARGRRFDLMSAIGNQREPRVQRIDCCVEFS